MFVALLLLIAGGIAVVEKRSGWRLFKVLPAIVLIYLVVTALAVAGVWQSSEEISQAQTLITRQLLPALLFLLLATCDLRAIWRLGPRLLGAFACATGSILVAFMLVYLLLGAWLGNDAPRALATLSGGWMGGTANLLAVKQAVALPESALTQVLVADAVCYSMWVMLLFAAVPWAARFNRWVGADERALAAVVTVAAPTGQTADADAGSILLWLGIALVVALGCATVAAWLPQSQWLGSTSWTMLLVTAAGLLCARTRLARLPGSAALGSALLALVVAALASQSSFAGLAQAPLFVLAGFAVLAAHGVLLVLLARLFRLDLFTCSVCSLANIGGVASAPLLAALHAPALVPVGVLLAMLGYIVGTGLGISLAAALDTLGAAFGYLT